MQYIIRYITTVFPLLAAGVILNSSAFAATIRAASCVSSDVQAAINSATAGDTIVLPPCTVTYTTPASNTPSVNINKAVTVQGQTICAGRATTLACTDQTIINDGTGTGPDEDPFLISVSGGRLTGITIFDPRPNGDYKFAVDTARGTTNWRIDHCHIHPSNTTTGGIGALGFGLIDHNYIDTANTGVSGQGDHPLDAKYNGDYNWSQPLNAGTANAIYIEDNEFVYSQVLNGIDNYDGARWVFRYNDVQGTNIANHGLDSTSNGRSTMLSEVYNNTFSNSGTHIYQWFVTRGGTYFVFNNVISASGGSFDLFIDLREYRADTSQYQWGICDGTNPIDGNTLGQQGWPCMDQVGRATNQLATPSYSWGNNWKGSAPTVANTQVCGSSDCSSTNRAGVYQILNNREFYVEAPNFNGTVGTGTGLLSARPATCSGSVGYWATDTNTLYQCSGANTWSAFYRPYSYPHPLQTQGSAPVSGITPPTNLVTIVR